MVRQGMLAAAIGWVLSGAAVAQSPSFDCGNARSAIEKAICASPLLALSQKELRPGRERSYPRVKKAARRK